MNHCKSLISRGKTNVSLLIGSFFLVLALPFISLAAAPGDANNDGKITQADVTAIINDILGIEPAPGNADCNQDGLVDIRDVICAINIISSLPPDPMDTAPPLDRTVATTLATATEFIYTGPNPIQTGVAPGTIEPYRVGVLRGKVLDRDGNPLTGVKITILNHPEYGQTLSRTDGMFDMVVNGGGLLTVHYEKQGYLTVQRQKDVPWQDYMPFPNVRMTPADPNLTIINLNDVSTDFQFIRGSLISDERGNRRSTVLVPKGDQALMVFPDGHEVPIASLSVRATEFTVGSTGLEAMPAELPSASAYTYCEEFTVEEALAAGAPEVRFTTPVVSYIENFLNFPVGTGIPLGAYNRERAVWIPSDNGKVIKILNISGGLAEIDTDGDNIADNGVSLGITDAERAALGALYTAGQSLWRVLIPHFTRPWDMNMGVMCEEPCFEPKNPAPFVQNPTCVDEETGSIIQCQSQVLAEDIPITGTPYHLRYQSDRVRGRTEKYTLAIPLTGSTISPTLRKITLVIEIAGQNIVREYAPGTNLNDTFVWDGKDVYGREVQGIQPITVRIGYGYKLIYGSTNRFGYNGNGIPISVSGGYFTLWQNQKGTIGTWDAKASGIGGWTLDVHQAYDFTTRAVHGGDGEDYGAIGKNGAIGANLIGAIVTTVAGGGGAGDGVPATNASLPDPVALAVDFDGSLYIAQWNNGNIRRVARDGIVTTIAGGGMWGYRGDGGPATSALLKAPGDIALGPDGSLYVADTGNHRVRRIGPDGFITTVAGNGTCPSCASFNCPPIADGPATEVILCNPSSVTVGPDGSLYILHTLDGTGFQFIRRVGPDGIITRFAGTEYYNYWQPFSGDGGLAANAGLASVYRIRAGNDGSLYMTMGYDGGRRVRRVGPNGIISTVAGGDGYCGARGWNGDPVCGDGGAAIGAQFYDIGGIGMGGGQTGFFVIDPTLQLVRHVGPDGIINTVAGSCCSYAYGYAGDGGLATQALFWGPSDVAMGPDGNLYIADSQNGRIRKVSTELPEMLIGFVPSEDGSQLYQFNVVGRHLRTLDSVTGAVLYTFEYDSGGRLTKITDRDGNVTTIQRDTSGNPTAILSPYGQQTNLGLDANGYLSSISNPAGETTGFAYTADGLMTGLTTPRNSVYTFSYDSLGRLQKDQDPAGGSKSLNRVEKTNGYDVTLTTAMGRATTYSLENLSTGDQHGVTTYPDGTQTDTLDKKDGSNTTKLPDGTTVDILLGPDPRFGMQSPLLKSMTVKTPGGIAMNVTTDSTVTLTDPANPLSLTKLTDTLKINGRAYTNTYSSSTLSVTKNTPLGKQVTTTIDTLGWVVKEQMAGLNAINYTYDSQGQMTQTTVGTGGTARTAKLVYDAKGYVATLTDALGGVLQFEYDPAGRVIAQTTPDGAKSLYEYDSEGNMTAVTPPDRPAHTFSYTATGLLSAYDPPDVGTEDDRTLYTYDADGQLSRVVKPGGVAADLTYDSAGHLSGLTSSRGIVTLNYDPATGQMKDITTPEGQSVAYSYDGMLSSSKAWTGAVVGSVSYTYDNNFLMTAVSVNGGSTTFQYDNDTLLTRAGDLTLARNAQNGLLTGTTLGSITDTWGYNGFSELVTYAAAYNGTPFYSLQYSYNALGRITQKVETIDGSPDTCNYYYDAAGRLVKIEDGTTVSTYSYDSNGNRVTVTKMGTTTTYSYDAQDRLITQSSALGTQSYSYTPNGELQSKINGTQTTVYDYDAIGNLMKVTLADGTKIEYIVDGQNRRIGKKVKGTLVQGFLYQDQLKPVVELDGTNQVVSRFVYGSRPNIPDYMVKGGVTYRIIADHLGSPRLVVNATTGEIAQRIDYDEFGEVISDTNPGFQPFGFAGGLYDHDTGLVRFGARDYDAETGRWTAKDPVFFASGQTNLYAYVGNDPVNLFDPEGKGFCDLFKSIYNKIKGWMGYYNKAKTLDDINNEKNPAEAGKKLCDLAGGGITPVSWVCKPLLEKGVSGIEQGTKRTIDKIECPSGVPGRCFQ